MPTVFSHAIFAIVTGKAGLQRRVSYWIWFLTAVCAMFPDADVISFYFGIRGGLLGHRGFTHSVMFAFLFGSFIAFLIHKFLQTGISFTKLAIFFSLATLSHPLLDMLTDGGPGVALFAPFTSERFFFPWQPIEVSPIGLRFFSHRGLDVILSEIIWVWLPAFGFFILMMIARKFVNSGKSSEPNLDN